MRLYRETRTVSRPPRLVREQLDETYGGSPWRTRRGPYTYRIDFDEAAGTLETTVAVHDAVGWLSVAVLPLVAVAAVLPLPVTGYLGMVWLAAGITVVTVSHLWPGISRRPTLAGTSLVERRVSPVVLPPLLATMGALSGGFAAAGAPILGAALGAALGAVALGAVFVAAFGRSATITTLAVPLSGVLPVACAGANVLVAGALLSAPTFPALAIALVAVVALAVDALFVLYCRAVLDSLREARTSVSSRWARLTCVGTVVVANGLLALVVVRGLGALAALARGASPTGVPVSGASLAFETPVLIPLAALVFAPVGYVVLGWMHAVVVAPVVRGVLYLRSSPADVGAMPVRFLPNSSVVAPLSVAGRRFVLVGESVAADLSADELAAVVAHETYHLRHRDRLVAVLASVLGSAVGGRNALLAFYDYEAVERAADDFAARTVGTEPLVRALRRLEATRAGRTAERPWLTAPYELLFGPVVYDVAHGSVDDRVARLAGQSATR